MNTWTFGIMWTFFGVENCLLFWKQNPGYMKENFMICIESLHIADTGEQDNVRDVSTVS